MEITDQQIQTIKDAYENADRVLKLMYENDYKLSQGVVKGSTKNAQLTLRYQEGRCNALRDVVDTLGLLQSCHSTHNRTLTDN